MTGIESVDFMERTFEGDTVGRIAYVVEDGERHFFEDGARPVSGLCFILTTYGVLVFIENTTNRV